MSIPVPYKMDISLLSPTPTGSGGLWIQQNFEKTADHLYTASGHIANYNNPHNVTAAQVGTYTSGTIISLISGISVTASGSVSRPTYINVKDYGATGDGSTDDTNAILSAVNTVIPATGSHGAYDWYTPLTYNRPARQAATLYFPSGVYKITRPIPIRGFATYCGDYKNSVIHAAFPPAASNSGAFHAHLDGNGYCSDWIIKDLYIWTEYGHGIAVPSGATSFLIKDLIISAKGWGIYTGNDAYCQSSRIQNVKIFTPGSGGIKIVGNLNELSQVDVHGAGVRAGFAGDAIEAMVVLQGSNYYCEQLHIEIGTGTKCLKIGGSGPTFPAFGNSNFMFESLWIENDPNSSGVTVEIDNARNVCARNSSYVTSGKTYINTAYNVSLDYANDSNIQFAASDLYSFVTGGTNPEFPGFKGRGEGRVSIDSEKTYGFKEIRYENMSRYGNMIDRNVSLNGRGSNVTLSFLNVTNIGPAWKAQWTTNPSGFFNISFYGVNPANTTDVNNDVWFSAFLDWDMWDSVNGQILAFFGLGSTTGPWDVRWQTKGPILTKLSNCSDLSSSAMQMYVYGGSGTIYIKDPSFIIGRDFQPPPPPQKYFYSSDGPIFGFGTAAPTTGYWTQGSRIFNSTPSAGGIPGWVCVASGVPGVWKNEASISA